MTIMMQLGLEPPHDVPAGVTVRRVSLLRMDARNESAQQSANIARSRACAVAAAQARRDILDYLRDHGEMRVPGLAAALGMSKTTAERRIGELAKRGKVTAKRDGRAIYWGAR